MQTESKNPIRNIETIEFEDKERVERELNKRKKRKCHTKLHPS